jgi:hypothetical protein
VTPDELRAEAAWVEPCSWSCPWPILTERDLADFASSVLDDPLDDLTVGEISRIKKLISRLEPPKELAQRLKPSISNRKGDLAKLNNLDEIFSRRLGEATKENWRPWQCAGARTRAENGRRKVIISAWGKLSGTPRHERASKVATRLGISPHWVRTVIREEEKRTNQI